MELLNKIKLQYPTEKVTNWRYLYTFKSVVFNRQDVKRAPSSSLFVGRFKHGTH